MQKPRVGLLEFVLSQTGDDHDEVMKVMRWVSVLNPLFDQAERGQSGLLALDALAVDDYCDALAMFLGSDGVNLMVEFASADRGDRVPRESSSYQKFLTNYVFERSGSEAVKKLAPDIVRRFRKVYWDTIGIRLFSFLTNRYANAFMQVDQRVVAVAAEGYYSLPLVYLLHVMADDAKAVAEMAPLMRQLAQAVPIGLLNKDHLATWLVLCG